jgi:transposase-like protein
MQDATPNPSCRTPHVVRNGSNQSGTPTFLCRGCGRRFVEIPKAGPVPPQKEALVRRLLGERVSLRAIARTAQVSRSWLQEFVNACTGTSPAGRPTRHPPAVEKSGSW